MIEKRKTHEDAEAAAGTLAQIQAVPAQSSANFEPEDDYVDIERGEC